MDKADYQRRFNRLQRASRVPVRGDLFISTSVKMPGIPLRGSSPARCLSPDAHRFRLSFHRVATTLRDTSITPPNRKALVQLESRITTRERRADNYIAQL